MASKKLKSEFCEYIKENYISSSVNIDLNYYQNQFNHLEIKSLTFIQKVVRLFSYFNLFYFNIDPHILYKKDFYPFNDYYCLYRTNMFKLKWNYWDRLRIKFSYLMRFIISYIIIKCILLNVFQLTDVYRNLHIDDDNNDSDINKLLKKLAQVYVANPLSESTGALIFVTFSLIFSLSQATLWLPYYYNKKPVDSVHCRLFMEPIVEICRMDAFILKELENIENSIKTKLLKVKLYKIENNQLENSLIYNYNYHKDIINLLKKKFWLIRPGAFNPQYTLYTYKYFFLFTIVAVILTLPLIVYIPVVVLDDISKIRCSRENYKSILFIIIALIRNDLNYKDNNYCSFLSTITFSEFITLFELIYGIVLLGYFLSIQAVWMLSDIFSHILLTNYDLEQDLSGCLIKLKLYNREFIFFEGTNGSKVKEKLEIGREFDCFEEEYGNFQLKIDSNIDCERISANDFSIDLTLMKILNKLYVNHINSIRNARFLTVMTSSFIGTIGFCLMLAILGGKLGGKDIAALRSIIIIWLLIMANTITLSCAYSYSRLARIEKLCFSILAQMLIRKNQLFSSSIDNNNIDDDDDYYCDHVSENKYDPNNQNYVVGLEELDIISFRWTKLVHSHGLSSDLNSVKLFNLINITFDRVLQMNFVLVTFSVFLSHNL